MIERLWNGWRAAYVTRGQGTQPPGDVSLFTSLLRSGRPDEETYIVRRGERVFAIMSVYPYTSGHLLVLPYRKVSELEDFDAEESREQVARGNHQDDRRRQTRAARGRHDGL